jgi:hypothetical protein
MKEKAKKTEYRSRHEFMADMSLMADNCMQFNGGTSVIFAYVQKLVQLAEEYIAEHVCDWLVAHTCGTRRKAEH